MENDTQHPDRSDQHAASDDPSAEAQAKIEKLNARLNAMRNNAASAHERLRGVQDALAVLQQISTRAQTDETDDIDDAEAWVENAERVADHSAALFEEAANLLSKTSDEIRTALKGSTVTISSDAD